MDQFVAEAACAAGEGTQLFHQILTDADGKHKGTAQPRSGLGLMVSFCDIPLAS